MSTEKKPAKRLYTLAAAIGLALGSMGIAAAASVPPRTAPAVGQTEAPSVGSQGTDAPDDVAGANEAEEVEVPGDEDIDGVDHQFEGEEIGNNGDGTPDMNEANKADEADEVDGVDYEFESEESGNNGDGIPDADDANEVEDTTNG